MNGCRIFVVPSFAQNNKANTATSTLIVNFNIDIHVHPVHMTASIFYPSITIRLRRAPENFCHLVRFRRQNKIGRKKFGEKISDEKFSDDKFSDEKFSDGQTGGRNNFGRKIFGRKNFDDKFSTKKFRRKLTLSTKISRNFE